MAETRAAMRVRKGGDAVSVIDIEGELTGESEAALSEAYTSTGGEGGKTVILNFTELEYMNSSGIGLLVAAPVMAVAALAIRLEGGGPVFYRQRRVGLHGQPFEMLKLRTMRPGSDPVGVGTVVTRDDPRVTRVGRFLRRTSLDELPQLFNVLLGEMSLVGPRPALVSDLERYEPHHFERLSVIPGITGAWQVGGRNLITDFETIFRLDRSYIRRWSLLLDIKILVRTLKVVITGEGAY